MKNFNKKPFLKRNNNRGDRGRTEMHSATCADCGKDCEVPFRPSGDKPVYCSSCFKKEESPRREDRGSEYGGNSRGERSRPGMHRATCADCGSNCEVPFRPSGDKPVYCSDCFRGINNSDSSKSDYNRSDKSSKKHDEINAKLDKILVLLQRISPDKETKVIKQKKEAVATKKVTPKKVAPKKIAKKKIVKKAVAKKTVSKKATKKVAPKKPAKKKIVKKAAAKKAAPKRSTKKKTK